jgi:protein required for attachment to host cells
LTVQVENQSDDVDPTHEELSTYAEKLVDLRKKVDMEVKANVNEAQKRQKKQYDAKHQQSSFEVDCSREEHEEAFKEGGQNGAELNWSL